MRGTVCGKELTDAIEVSVAERDVVGVRPEFDADVVIGQSVTSPEMTVTAVPPTRTSVMVPAGSTSTAT